MQPTTPIALRLATPADEPALLRLAAIDSAAALRGELLVAEMAGELLAALSLTDGRTIADPFRHTADLVELLRTRARLLQAPEDDDRRGRRTLTAAVAPNG